MSHFDYVCSREIAGEDYPFAALIMAAMRKADSHNLAELQTAFPGIWNELQERYNSPGGFTLAEIDGMSRD